MGEERKPLLAELEWIVRKRGGKSQQKQNERNVAEDQQRQIECVALQTKQTLLLAPACKAILCWLRVEFGGFEFKNCSCSACTPNFVLHCIDTQRNLFHDTFLLCSSICHFSFLRLWKRRAVVATIVKSSCEIQRKLFDYSLSHQAQYAQL